jgi:hypothetical protein
MLRASLLLLVLPLAFGCDDDPPPFNFDAGPRPDGGAMMDGGAGDAGEPRDGDVEDPDGGPVDAGDADPPQNEDFEGFGAGDPIVCADDNPARPPSCTGTGDCDDGEECIPGGCRGRYCAPAGRACTGDESCADGERCGEGGVCEGIDTFCVADSACPPGFVCNPDGVCLDKRLPCVGDAGCPPTMRCVLPVGAGHRVCVPALQTCVGSTNCPAPDQCLDVDGEGDTRCFPPGGECASDADCAAPARCAISITTGLPACSLEGLCASDDDCDTASSYRCNDTHLTGETNCQAPAFEDCGNSLGCPDNSLCFDHDEDGLAECTCFDTATLTLAACTDL